ncbi:hypothetical protein CRG98_046292 [Punica granatum]|uniref:Uncharacterized protein n=1 Tax=Punica granatum TaxID=22663 RepID=A0A2I0HNK6_PUNGR|nr:hypothetical protein CRG98_046292 [Punica granatum]
MAGLAGEGLTIGATELSYGIHKAVVKIGRPSQPRLRVSRHHHSILVAMASSAATAIPKSGFGVELSGKEGRKTRCCGREDEDRIWSQKQKGLRKKRNLVVCGRSQSSVSLLFCFLVKSSTKDVSRSISEIPR